MNQFLKFVLLFGVLSLCGLAVTDPTQGETPNLPDSAAMQHGGMPGWPVPEKPIPHHDVGEVSKANSYQTTVQLEQPIMNLATGEPTRDVSLQDVALTGVDALAADRLDPLAGNYTLVNWNSILLGSASGADVKINTYEVVSGTLGNISSESLNTGATGVNNHVASADLNNDGQAEQIVAYAGVAGQIFLSIGEMPGTDGRATSTPAAIVHDNGDVDLLVRGYDEALWHIHYSDPSWGEWNNLAGGTLLSSPAIASRGDGTFDVFVVGTDNCTYQRHYDGSNWDADWGLVETSAADCTLLDFWIGETPELPASAAVARGSGLDLFRIGPDNTLRWNHSSDGITWDGWQSLGGMLASGPGVISTGANNMQVFVRGVDETLWFRTYNGSWGAWQRSELIPGGVTIASAPTVSSAGVVYVRGSDNQVWYTNCDSSSCTGWTQFLNAPGNTLASGVALGDGWVMARTTTGRLEYSSADGLGTWTLFASLPPWVLNFGTGRSGWLKPSNWNNGTVRITPGYFLGNGREQLALGYFSDVNTVEVVAYQTMGGFTLNPLSSYTLTHNADWFSMTTGDFLDKDGIDEIAIAYVNGTTYGVEILKFSGTALVSAQLSYEVAAHSFAGTLDVVAGDFNGDNADEIAMLWLDFYNANQCLDMLKIYHIRSHWRIFEVSSSTLVSHDIGYTDTEVHYDSNPWQIGFAIAAGDTDGDGVDEIARTWPYSWGSPVWWVCYGNVLPSNQLTRKLEVLEINPTDWSVTGQAIETRGPSDISWTDRLAIGDLNRDYKNEIVWAEHANWLRTYYYNSETSVYESFSNALGVSPSFGYSTLITGNFTREGIRVGPPTYRLQNRVDSILAELNMPPKHWDMIRNPDGTYQVIKIRAEECWTTPNDPKCTNTSYGVNEGTTSTTAIETQRNWSVGGEVGVKKGIVDFSLSYTYGNNFSKVTTTIAQTEYSTGVTAGYDDAIIYYGNPYRVWEYPILSSNSTEPDGYLAVIFPDVTQSNLPNSEAGTICEYGWYNPGHQPYNVWSYDPVGDIQYLDYDPANDLAKAIYGASDNAFKVYFKDLEEVKTSNAHSHEVKAKLEFGFAKWLKANVNGSFDYEESQTDITLTSDETFFSAYLTGINTADNFTTKAIAYWSTTGPLVIDFQTEPNTGDHTGTTWQLYNKPDPAFILPWYGFPAETDADLPYPDPNNHGAPPCGSEKQYFSYDVAVDPPFVSAGETITVTATVRNFSNESIEQVVTVQFYQGLPGTVNNIGNCTIDPFARINGPQTCTIHWVASGAGEQKIYAVIDPDDGLTEMHDENHVINNNMGYGVLQVGKATYIDEGAPEAYTPISYRQNQGLEIALYTSPANLAAVTRLDLREDATRYPSIVGHPFEIVAIQGDDINDWGTDIANFSLRPTVGDPPAVILVDYSGASLAGFDENLLTLYRLYSGLWVEATCPNYEVIRFPGDNRLFVPICQTGTFVLSDQQPEGQAYIFLPLIGR